MKNEIEKLQELQTFCRCEIKTYLKKIDISMMQCMFSINLRQNK